MAERSDESVTREELVEILEDFVTRPELRELADAQATANSNGVLIRALIRALVDNGVVTEDQIEVAKPS